MPALPPAVSIKGLRKAYRDVVAVDGLDLKVHTGECFGLLGPNGAGKTTTIEIAEGLNTPDSGTVTVLGQNWLTGGRELRQRIGISLQETQFSEKLTVQETLALFRSFYAKPAARDAALDAVQLGEKRHGRVGQLSGGQRQRLALACALVGDPELFFLDEPTTGLDPQSRRQLWGLIGGIKRAGRTVVITTHYMEEAERLCDRVAIVDRGRVIALGTPRELIAGLGAQHVIEFRAGSTTHDESHAGDAAGTADAADATDATDNARINARNGGHDAAPSALLDDAALLSLDGAVSVRRKNGSYLLESSQAHVTVPALLTFLNARGLPLDELTTHSATLEDVFVHLTGRHLRDA